MSQSQPVPKLDLAPKLRRPLSLWNPLDYLRLLYWMFYFPQAIRWYVDVFAEDETDCRDARTWAAKLRWLRNNPIQVRLIQQLTFLRVLPFVVIPLSIILDGGESIKTWLPSTILLIVSTAMLNVVLMLSFGIADTIGGLTSNSHLVSNVFVNLASRLAGSVTVGVFFAIIIGVPISLGFGATTGVGSGVAIGALLSLTVSVFELDILGWFFGLHPGTRKFRRQQWLFLRKTPLPLLFLTKQLTICLQQDWQSGLEVVDQLVRYTSQLIPVIRAINFVLLRTPPERLISHTALLAQSPYDWNLVRYASASLGNALKAEFLENLCSFCPRPIKRKMLGGINTDLRLDSSPHAVAAGFWHLYYGQTEQSIEAFQVVENLPHGKEMLLLATILDRAQISDLQQIATLNLPPTPHSPLLRPETWNAIAAIRRASEDIRVVCNAASRTARAFASNRALGDLNAILEAPDQLPKAERKLILSIARTWRDSLLKSVGEIGRIEILKPVQNPYITGDPVEGSLFVGRDDILKQLEELWFVSERLQSVVLYGHRRMGKTSLLRNVNNRLGSNTQLIYVNLLNLGEVTQGAGEVLLSICDEIAQATNHPAPSDTDLINLPYPTFRRYLQSLIQSPNSKGLIIALDEFEKLEDLITAEKLSPDFLSYLRGLVQMSPKIAFAFAGLHTLEEMTEDYFSPFFASIIPIRLSFLDRASTRQLLANPSDDFPLDYAPDLYDEIFDLTAGQPYLVQLLGFQLVRRYNAQVFEQGRDRSHQFSIDDLTAITESSDLYDNGRYYFTGVWQQAAQSPPGQQDILKAIAHQGLSRDVLLQQFDSAQFDAAIEALRRHDVVHEVNQTWCIKVELFQRWVMKYVLT
jgi:hypothetical protein